MAAMKTISEIIKEVSPYYKKKEPEAEHTIDYDSSSETLEPIYFFVLDLMGDVGLEVEKLVDNFSSTPGSPLFSETGIKASRIQDEAMKIMASANAVLRSILNLVYDLRDFQTRLQHYDSLKSKNEQEKDSAILALKQIWMDKVDISKGNSSIKAMALGQAGFQTLIDAFLFAKTPEDVDNMDLNDRVKRILKPRVYEFQIWLGNSEKELRKRYEVEKTYLKSQVNSMKIYSRWVKPYLKSAQQLEMKDSGKEPSLVNMFNTLRLELTLLGKSKIKVKESALGGKLPKEFANEKMLKSIKRDYYSCILVDFTFRAVPRQGTFIGKSTMTFKAYALNDEELKKLNQEIEKSDWGDMLQLIEGATTESLDQLKEDIDYFLKEPEKTEEKKDESNPFLALFGYYNKKENKISENRKTEEKKENKEIIVKPDNWIESEHIRKLAAESAKETCFTLFDVYKKVHNMPSYT
jgi:hypothetical protein